MSRRSTRSLAPGASWRSRPSAHGWGNVGECFGSGSLHHFQNQPLVEAAAAVALEIERDVAIADRLQLDHDLGAVTLVHQDRHAGGVGLDAGDMAVVADAYLAHADAAQVRLGEADLLQRIDAHGRT